MNDDEVALRPATDDDFEFLIDLHRRCFQTYVEQTWGSWDEADQLRRVRQFRWAHDGSIIVFRDLPIGALAVKDQISAVFLELIAILPEYQCQGLGTKLIRKVLAKADAQKVPVRLHVLKVNPARSLYERLGFGVASEDQQRYYMERPAPLRQQKS